MPRLLSLLLILALAVTNGPAVAAAMCRHDDGRAHAAARHSADAAVAAAARGEEEAAQAALEKAPLGDAASGLLAGYVLPPDARVPAPRLVRREARETARAAPLHGRSPPPLLEP
ncbi:MAG: hypothetical protein ACK4ST_10935, partial [Elioraea tepidiphila]